MMMKSETMIIIGVKSSSQVLALLAEYDGEEGNKLISGADTAILEI